MDKITVPPDKSEPLALDESHLTKALSLLRLDGKNLYASCSGITTAEHQEPSIRPDDRDNNVECHVSKFARVHGGKKRATKVSKVDLYNARAQLYGQQGIHIRCLIFNSYSAYRACCVCQLRPRRTLQVQ